MITVGFQLVSIDPSEVKGLGKDGVGDIPVMDGGTLADAMGLVGLPASQPFMTMVNGNPVAPEDREKKTLSDGDQIVVFPPIEGG
jgi:sulfur carrier protein ThiS